LRRCSRADGERSQAEPDRSNPDAVHPAEDRVITQVRRKKFAKVIRVFQQIRSAENCTRRENTLQRGFNPIYECARITLYTDYSTGLRHTSEQCIADLSPSLDTIPLFPYLNDWEFIVIRRSRHSHSPEQTGRRIQISKAWGGDEHILR
jgi:hypothetical protein